MKIETKTSFKSAERIPTGDYDAVLYGIINIGPQTVQFKDKDGSMKVTTKPMLKLLFEFPSLLDDNGESRTISKNNVAASAHELSKLVKIAKALLGTVTVDASGFANELASNLEQLLGSTAAVTVSEFIPPGKTDLISFISDIKFLDRRLPQPVGTRTPVIFDFNKPDLNTFRNVLTPPTRKEIMSGPAAGTLPKDIQEVYVELESQQASKAKAKSQAKADFASTVNKGVL